MSRLMDNLKDLRTEWKQLGEEHRKTFQPSVSGVPLRVFRWWENKTGKYKRPVNFCHFFWAVVLWAPLLWLRQRAGKFLHSSKGPIVIGLVLVAAFAALCIAYQSVFYTAVGVLGAAIAITYVIWGFKLAYWALSDIVDDPEDQEQPPGWYSSLKRNPSAMLFLVALSAPMLILLALLCGLIYFTDTQAAKSAWHWYARRQRFNTSFTLRGYTGFAIFAGVEIACMLNGLWDIPIITLIVAVVFGLAVAVGVTSDRIAQKRKLEREQKSRTAEVARAWSIATHLEPALQILFEHQHPRKVGNRNSFLIWKQRYFNRVIDLHGTSEWEYILDSGRLPFYSRSPLNREISEQIFRTIIDLRLALYAPVKDDQVNVKSRVPSSVKVAGSTVAAFVSMIWQMLTSLKWQICPWVKVEDS